MKPITRLLITLGTVIASSSVAFQIDPSMDGLKIWVVGTLGGLIVGAVNSDIIA